MGARNRIIMVERTGRRRRPRPIIMLVILSLSFTLPKWPTASGFSWAIFASRSILFAYNHRRHHSNSHYEINNPFYKNRRYIMHREVVMSAKTKSLSSSSLPSSSSTQGNDRNERYPSDLITMANRTSLQVSESIPPPSSITSPRSLSVTPTVDALDEDKANGSCNGHSEVAYDRVLMPRPNQKSSLEPAIASTQSLVSWEEVVLPVPSTSLKKGGVRDLANKDSIITVTAMATLIGLFVSLVSASGPGAWRYYLSGGICAAASHAIPVPIDVVKTRKQVDPALANHSFLAATKHIIQQEGIKALLVGLGPTTVGYLVEGSIKFGVYEASKPVVKSILTSFAQLSTGLSFLNSHVLSLILCGSASGFAAALALCPMESLRIRLVAQPGYATNWVQGGYKMLQKEGPSCMIKGMLPMMYKQVPYTIVKNASFDLGTKAWYALLRNQAVALTPTIKLAIPFVSAAIASVLSCVSSQPGDMLLSLVTAREGDSRRTHDIIRDIMRSERGLAGFFVGLKTRLLHVGVIVTLQLLIYDLVKQLCGIAPTGSV